MQRKNQLNQNAYKLAEILPAWQAEVVLQLTAALERSEKHNAQLREAIEFAIAPDLWDLRDIDDNIYQYHRDRVWYVDVLNKAQGQCDDTAH